MTTVNSQNQAPLYQQIADNLRMKIMAEEWKVGDRIPTEMALCDIYHASRITVRKAIELLVQEDLLYRKKAKGTFVKDATHESVPHFTMVKSFTKEMAELGKVAKTMFAEVSVVPANINIARYLNLNVGDSMIELRRIRGTGGQKFAYFKTYIPFDNRLSLKSEDYYGSFYAYLAKFGIVVTRQREYIEAVLPTPEVQTNLNLNHGLPVLKRVRFISNNDNTYREYTECYYVGTQYRYYVDFN